MADDNEQRKEGAGELTPGDALNLGRELYVRHACFPNTGSIGDVTLHRYGSFIQRAAAFTASRLSGPRQEWNGWLDMQWLENRRGLAKQVNSAKSSSSVARKATALPGELHDSAAPIAREDRGTTTAEPRIDPEHRGSAEVRMIAANSVGDPDITPATSLQSGSDVAVDLQNTAGLHRSEDRVPADRLFPVLTDRVNDVATPGKAAALDSTVSEGALTTAPIVRTALPSGGQHKVMTYQGPPIYQRSKTPSHHSGERAASLPASVESRADLAGQAFRSTRANGEVLAAMAHPGRQNVLAQSEITAPANLNHPHSVIEQSSSSQAIARNAQTHEISEARVPFAGEDPTALPREVSSPELIRTTPDSAHQVTGSQPPSSFVQRASANFQTARVLTEQPFAGSARIVQRADSDTLAGTIKASAAASLSHKSVEIPTTNAGSTVGEPSNRPILRAVTPLAESVPRELTRTPAIPDKPAVSGGAKIAPAIQGSITATGERESSDVSSLLRAQDELSTSSDPLADVVASMPTTGVHTLQGLRTHATKGSPSDVQTVAGQSVGTRIPVVLDATIPAPGADPLNTFSGVTHSVAVRGHKNASVDRVADATPANQSTRVLSSQSQGSFPILRTVSDGNADQQSFSSHPPGADPLNTFSGVTHSAVVREHKNASVDRVADATPSNQSTRVLGSQSQGSFPIVRMVSDGNADQQSLSSHPPGVGSLNSFSGVSHSAVVREHKNASVDRVADATPANQSTRVLGSQSQGSFPIARMVSDGNADQRSLSSHPPGADSLNTFSGVTHSAAARGHKNASVDHVADTARANQSTRIVGSQSQSSFPIARMVSDGLPSHRIASQAASTSAARMVMQHVLSLTPMRYTGDAEQTQHTFGTVADGTLFRSPAAAASSSGAGGPSLPPVSSAMNPTGTMMQNFKSVDLTQLASRVYELLVRRLSSERQQRGF